MIGLIATEIVFGKTDYWLSYLLNYIESNINNFISFIEKEVPLINVIKLEETY